jgi:N-acetyl-alpha-D-glucosaminyl L-malate synthase BshA
VSDRLTIGMVCYPSLGGSGVVAVELAAGMVRRGHRVHVIASAPPRRQLPAVDGLRFHPVPVSDYPLFEQPPYEWALAATMAAVASDHRVDVLHVHYAVPHAASAYLARQPLGARAPRLVITLHGTDVTRFGSDPRYREITRFTVTAADALTVPSHYLRGEALRLLGPDEPAIDVIPNFVDTDHFTPAAWRERSRLNALFDGAGEDSPVLFHVSNFRPVKRVVDLLEVLARIRTAAPARLVLVGDGPDRAAAAERARSLGVSGHVCFLGDRADFAELLREADAFVLPSESESFGVAALEALSAGVPVFGYRVAGLPELVVDGVGRLVPPFDTAALASAVSEVIFDPARRDQLGRAARAHAVAQFGREPGLDRYDAVYRRVLSQS